MKQETRIYQEEATPLYEGIVALEDTLQTLEPVLPYLTPQETGTVVLGTLLDEEFLGYEPVTHFVNLVTRLHSDDPGPPPDYIATTQRDTRLSLRTHFHDVMIDTIRHKMAHTEPQQIKDILSFLEEASYVAPTDSIAAPERLRQATQRFRMMQHREFNRVLLHQALRFGAPAALLITLSLIHGRSQNDPMIAISHIDKGTSRLALYDVDSNNFIDLKRNEQSSLEYPVWSPDGKKLAYVEKNPEWDSVLAIWDLQTGTKRYIPLQGQISHHPTWTYKDDIFVTMLPYQQNSQQQMFRIDATTGKHKNLGHGINPICSPNGKWIVYENVSNSAGNGGSKLWIKNSDGIEQYPVSNQFASMEQPTWSTENVLAFRGIDDYQTDIYTFDPVTLGLHNITNSPKKIENSPTWSPDGKTLAYVTYFQSITLHDTQTGEKLKLGSEVHPLDITFSPDGKHIAARAWGKYGRSTLVLIPLEKPNLEQIVTSPFSSYSWQPKKP